MNTRHYLLVNRHLQDFNPISAGEQQCKPSHTYGPAIRDYTLIHYVRNGCGTFYARGGVYKVKAGEVFLIRPGEITTYSADKDDPWDYQWIGFDGALSVRFDDLPAVFPVSDSLFRQMQQICTGSETPEYLLASWLFQLYVELFADSHKQHNYTRKIKNYIQTCYMNDISVEGISEMLQLNRRYLSRHFKKETGMTIQEYLLQVRMENAAELLKKGVSVKEAAELCGYADPFNFSRMFKKTYGVSPSQWTKKQK